MPKIRKLLLFVLSFALLSLAPAAGYCAGTTNMTQPQTVMIQLSQYNRLQTIITQQEMTLTQLQDRLMLLKSSSTEQQQLLIDLQNQLQDCKTQLQETRLSLTSAKNSLTKADETLQRQDKSLQTLTTQIKSMEHKRAVIKRQRDTWAIAAGVLLVGLAAK